VTFLTHHPPAMILKYMKTDPTLIPLNLPQVYSSISMPPACHLFGINGSSTTHGSLPHMDHYQTYNVGLKKWQPKCQLPLDNPDMLGKLRHTEDIGQANQPNSNHLATLMPPVELPVDYQPPHGEFHDQADTVRKQYF
jgi:hypothetical protein